MITSHRKKRCGTSAENGIGTPDNPLLKRLSDIIEKHGRNSAWWGTVKPLAFPLYVQRNYTYCGKDYNRKRRDDDPLWLHIGSVRQVLRKPKIQTSSVVPETVIRNWNDTEVSSHWRYASYSIRSSFNEAKTSPLPSAGGLLSQSCKKKKNNPTTQQLFRLPPPE